jgi:arsenate reductase-like glutaredoxin family protein
VQIFGVKKSAETRTALRFFSERRIDSHFVDLTRRAPSPAELERFAQKFGVHALIDVRSRSFVDLGLAPVRHSDARWLALLIEHPSLIRVPLVRCGKALSIGLAEAEWKMWLFSDINSCI